MRRITWPVNRVKTITRLESSTPMCLFSIQLFEEFRWRLRLVYEWAIFHFSKWRPSAILDFSKLKISTSGPVRKHNVRHPAKFREDRSSRSGDIADFLFLRWRPSAIIDFQTLEILTSGPPRRPNMRHRAKFHGDRSNRSGDMADFRFFKMAAVRHLGFVLSLLRPPTKSIWLSLWLCNIWL